MFLCCPIAVGGWDSGFGIRRRASICFTICLRRWRCGIGSAMTILGFWGTHSISLNSIERSSFKFAIADSSICTEVLCGLGVTARQEYLTPSFIFFIFHAGHGRPRAGAIFLKIFSRLGCSIRTENVTKVLISVPSFLKSHYFILGLFRVVKNWVYIYSSFQESPRTLRLKLNME